MPLENLGSLHDLGRFGIAVWPSRRAKPFGRRLVRDLRVVAPFAAVLVEVLVLAATIVTVERLVAAADPRVTDPRLLDYGPTTSISSTSNVSAEPPGIVPGDPRSP